MHIGHIDRCGPLGEMVGDGAVHIDNSVGGGGYRRDLALGHGVGVHGFALFPHERAFRKRLIVVVGVGEPVKAGHGGLAEGNQKGDRITLDCLFPGGGVGARHHVYGHIIVVDRGHL